MWLESRFAIVAVFVDDLNLVSTPKELTKTANYLKNEFEMKDLEKALKHFHMDKAHPLSSPMVVRSLDVKKDSFRPKEDDEDTLGPEVPYLSAIGALMYLTNCTRPDIASSVNLLARYSSAPTLRHWKGVKSKDHRSAGLWWLLLSSGDCLGGYGRLLKSFQPLIVAFVSAGDAVDHSLVLIWAAMADFLVFLALISSSLSSAAAGVAATDHCVTEFAVDRWVIHRGPLGGVEDQPPLSFLGFG
uniref:Reverse transcriptase Ty1/copia-type domain-containing protein n=1 Tax=Fagus sylvatica TaxID=28930 RepID=A0A2N9IE35_FAGSY